MIITPPNPLRLELIITLGHWRGPESRATQPASILLLLSMMFKTDRFSQCSPQLLL